MCQFATGQWGSESNTETTTGIYRKELVEGRVDGEEITETWRKARVPLKPGCSITP